MISAITPTCDRPVAFAMCEAMMARQTVKPDQWIVADGGEVKAECTMGQTHLWDPRPPGAANFAHNLLNAIARVTGDFVVVIEDDDAYQRSHIETVTAALQNQPSALLAGDDRQRYYNVAKRCWRLFSNVGASMCQTAMRKEVVPVFQNIIRDCIKRNTYGIDTTLWRAVPKARWALTGMTVVGIKGLPGRAGLGVGHRPDGRWTPDPDLAQLRRWIGPDADTYVRFAEAKAA